MALEAGDCLHCGCPENAHMPQPCSNRVCRLCRFCGGYSGFVPRRIKPSWREVMGKLDRTFDFSDDPCYDLEDHP